MKSIVIRFESFGFYNPTTISFCEEQSDKKSIISFTQCDIHIIASAIKGILKSKSIDNALFITSSKLFNSIKQRTTSNFMSVNELFQENGIKILDVGKNHE